MKHNQQIMNKKQAFLNGLMLGSLSPMFFFNPPAVGFEIKFDTIEQTEITRNSLELSFKKTGEIMHSAVGDYEKQK